MELQIILFLIHLSVVIYAIVTLVCVTNDYGWNPMGFLIIFIILLNLFNMYLRLLSWLT